MLFNFKKGETIASSFHLNLARHLILEFFKIYYEIQAIQQSGRGGRKEEIKRQLVKDYDMIDLTSSNWLFITNTFKDVIKWWSGDDSKDSKGTTKRQATSTGGEPET